MSSQNCKRCGKNKPVDDFTRMSLKDEKIKTFKSCNLCAKHWFMYSRDKKNRDKAKINRAIRVKCECGSEISKGNISTHRKSKKHTKLLIKINKKKIA